MSWVPDFHPPASCPALQPQPARSHPAPASPYARLTQHDFTHSTLPRSPCPANRRQIHLGEMEDSRDLGRPGFLTADDESEEQHASTRPPCGPPRVPARPVKRLGMRGVQLEPEYLVDRLRDALEQMQLSCATSEARELDSNQSQLRSFYSACTHWKRSGERSRLIYLEGWLGGLPLSLLFRPPRLVTFSQPTQPANSASQLCQPTLPANSRPITDRCIPHGRL